MGYIHRWFRESRMSTLNPLFKDLVDRYMGAGIKYPQLKAITAAQWLLESSRGNSSLSQTHYNFGGLKWRSEMQGYACKVRYTALGGHCSIRFRAGL